MHIKTQSEECQLQTLTENSGNFTDEQLTAALLHAEDVLSRCSIPFVVLGSAAYQMRNNIPLEGSRIVLGVLKRHAMPECTSLLSAIDPNIETLMDGYRLVTDGVPVLVKVLTKDYVTLLEPDIVFSHYEAWRIPNPFDTYWAGPHLDI